MSPSTVDVAIIGAGPYGLSLSAHLRAHGVEHRVFGIPMYSWRSMPPNMYLKSFDFATNIYTPQQHYTFREYLRARGIMVSEPVEIATFAEYGVWVREQVVPDVDEVEVTALDLLDNGFLLTLANGERVRACRVVSAIGLTYFERIPSLFEELPPELASHTSQHRDFSRFAGMDVTVIGAGQSALQAAALLHENGALVRLLARGNVWWSGKMPEKRSIREQILYPQTVLGPGRANWVLQHVPMYVYHMSEEKRISFVQRHLGPMGAWWLRDRVQGQLPIHEHTTVVAAEREGRKVRLRVTDKAGDEREILTDHIVAGTGFDVNVDHISILSRDLAARIRRVVNAPALSPTFESSVPGLYFVGPSSAFRFGPLFRFVAGAQFTSLVLARHLAAITTRTSAARIGVTPENVKRALTTVLSR